MFAELDKTSNFKQENLPEAMVEFLKKETNADTKVIEFFEKTNIRNIARVGSESVKLILNFLKPNGC
mgnify:CR=1 FL=1